MNRTLTGTAILVATLLGPACGDPSSADVRIETVDMLLARVCQLAAACPGVSATPQDLDDCPLGIRSQLGPSEIAELAQFVTLSRAQQGTVPASNGTSRHRRFGRA